MRLGLAVCIVALTCLAAGAASAQEENQPPDPAHAAFYGQRIGEIVVEGNSKTTTETVLLIADIKPGHMFRPTTPGDLRLRLINCGLFKSVDFRTAPSEKGGVKLTIIARDKHSWVIAPTFYNQPGNVGGGVGFGEANLFGKNKQLLLYGQIASADSLFVAAYQDPSISNTRFSYQLLLFLRREKVTEYTNPDGFFDEPVPERISTMHYLNSGLELGMNLFAGLALKGRLRGAYVTYQDPHWDSILLERGDRTGVPAAPEVNGWDVSYEAKLVRDKRANWHGVTTGSRAQLHYERGLPALGSDYDYEKLTFSLDIGLRVHKTHNLMIRTGIGTGDDLPFQQEFTSGGTDLRGYTNRQFRGDSKLWGNLEYSLPLFSIGPLTFRGMAFWDTAATTFLNEGGNPQRNYLAGQTGSNINEWRNGVGGGFRVYINSIVLPLLGVDWGYGLEARDHHIYFALGLLDGG